MMGVGRYCKVSVPAVTGSEGLAVFLILSVVAGGSGLSYVPEGVSWAQIAMRSSSVMLGSMRVWETTKGEVPSGEASL